MRLSTFIVSSVALTIQRYSDLYRAKDQAVTLEELEKDFDLPRIQTYDFIIAGGGPAGTLVAEKLSQWFTVLLLEKGGQPPPATYNLRRNIDVYTHPAINDFYQTTPQRFAHQETGGVGIIQGGTMLGGSGSHNFNIYNRGSPLDFDNWANITGDPSWRYEFLLDHFKEFESYTGILVNEQERNQYYAETGPFNVVTETPKHLRLWLSAGAEIGYPVADANGYQIPSFSPLARSTRNGVRESGYTAFLKRLASTRSSLTIHKYSFVQRILINQEKAAYGVAYTRHDIPQIAHANKEVIVTAGPFGSPALLIKSGIGPAKLLRKAKIPVMANLPGVGRNLQDHLVVNMTLAARNKEAAYFWLPVITESQVETELMTFHQENRQGVYTASVGPDTQATYVSSHAISLGQSLWSDMQINLGGDLVVEPDTPTVHLYVFQGRVKSRGELKFNVTAYLEGERDDVNLFRPDMRYFEDPIDLEIFIEALQFGLKVVGDTSAFRILDIKYNETTPRNCQGYLPPSREYLACYIMNRADTAGHRSGTCKMGQQIDPMAVVDSKLRVYGIKNLRVMDSSIMPEIPNMNLNSPTLVIAQKGASELLREYLVTTGTI